MPTIRQKKLANSLVENLQADKPLNKQELVASVGYSPNVAEKKAKEIIESKGTQQELRKLGFDPDTAKEIVGEILTAGENDTVKLKAADMVFKVHGSYAAEKHVNLNLEVEADEVVKGLTAHLNELYRGTSVPSDGEAPRALDAQAQD